MILYLDTSAMVKLYVEDENRDVVVTAIEASEMIVTSTVAYAEARAALARKRRDGSMDDNGHRHAVADLDNDWSASTHMDVSVQLSHHAGELAEQYALRGFDSIHLASALRFAGRFRDLSFLAFDGRLNEAARTASLALYNV